MALFSKFLNKVKAAIAPASGDWDELTTTLIEADIGSAFAQEIIESSKRAKPDEIEAGLIESMKRSLSANPRELARAVTSPTIVMVVGVNGTGKTTSVAKLLGFLKAQNSSLLAVAADTFRAAAIDQLQTWGQRLGVEVMAGKFQGDPSAVVFDAVTQAKKNNTDYVVIDTAGRLHTQNNLMDELTKIKKVAEKSSGGAGVDEVLLVVDATTGQNGIVQAKSFIQAVGVTGLILTKLDGSARGGIALAIERETGVPIKFIGTGEGSGDFAPFDADRYLQGLLHDPA